MVLGNPYAPARNKLGFKLRTHDRWLTGYVNTTKRRLADLLNSDEGSKVIVAAEVSVQHDWLYGQGGGRTMTYANISTSTVLFAIPIEGAPRQPDIAIRSTRRTERVLVGVGPYEIEGDLFLLPEVRPREVLVSLGSSFIVLAEAVIRQAGDRDSCERYDAVLLNRDRIDFIGSAT